MSTYGTTKEWQAGYDAGLAELPATIYGLTPEQFRTIFVAATSYFDDWSSGLDDGTYNEETRDDCDELELALAAYTGKPANVLTDIIDNIGSGVIAAAERMNPTPKDNLYNDGMLLRGLLAEACDEIELSSVGDKNPDVSDLVDRIRAALDQVDEGK